MNDPLGDPVCRITSGPEGERNARGRVRAEENGGMVSRRRRDRSRSSARRWRPPGLTTHAYGGTRMGDNPETNVVDRWGFSHEAPNLGMLGASVMGTSGARNPTLTVQALAWRTAEHLVKNWKSIAT